MKRIELSKPFTELLASARRIASEVEAETIVLLAERLYDFAEIRDRLHPARLVVATDRQEMFRTVLDDDVDLVPLMQEPETRRQQLSQALLEAMGCTVRRVADADAAYGELVDEAVAFDVVLSDIAMPGASDGIALGTWVRRHHPEIGVVLMTGYAERLGRANEQGLVVLLKPCEPTALAQALWDAHRAVVVGAGAAGLPGTGGLAG